MKRRHYYYLLTILLVYFAFAGCSNPFQEVNLGKPELRIKIRDDTGKAITGARVRLYKRVIDSSLTQISDSTGLVVFSGLDLDLYYWLADQGCRTNRTSQMTLDRPLTLGAVYYGYSVLAETGTVKITTNTSQTFTVFDSVVTIRVNRDTPYIAARRVKSYLIHSENINTPGVGKDTTIKIRCSDTTALVLPY